MNNMFKIGDIVKGKKNNETFDILRFAIMRIVDVDTSGNLIVEIIHHKTKPITKGLTFIVQDTEVELVRVNVSEDDSSEKHNDFKAYEKITIYKDGNKMVAMLRDKKAVARCHPDDEFNFMVGAKLALHRLDEIISQPLYYVKFADGNENSYLNVSTWDSFIIVSGKEENGRFKTKFTIKEIEAINPNYLPFAVRVKET